MPNAAELMRTVSGLPQRAQQAVLPFAIMQQWGIGCAYERSAKFSARRFFANRYLLAVSTQQVSLDAALNACRELAMPASAQAQFARRYHRSAMFYMGFEDAGDFADFKVYLELKPTDRPTVLSHIGWKWRAPEPSMPSGESPLRTTFYRRVRCRKFGQHLDHLRKWSDPAGSPSAAFTQSVLELSRQCCSQLICTEVTEVSGRCSYDWNVYAAELLVGNLSSSLQELFASYALDATLLERLLHLAAKSTLGHVAGGTGADGHDFCTIYWAANRAS